MRSNNGLLCQRSLCTVWGCSPLKSDWLPNDVPGQGKADVFRDVFLHQNIPEHDGKNDGMATHISLREEDQPRCQFHVLNPSLEIRGLEITLWTLTCLLSKITSLTLEFGGGGWGVGGLHFCPQDNILPARFQSCEPNQLTALEIL